MAERKIYCIVPRELADALHEPLRRHFRDEPGVEVVVERRERERRGGAERRAEPAPKAWGEPPGEERRQVRATAGRRAGERRAALRAVQPPGELPRRARRHAEQLTFVERVEPGGDAREDRDTARLVARIQAGDREAFGDLYLRYYNRVFSYMRVALRNVHDAEDATQQVFAQALAGLPKYERRSQPFRAWLFVIARNLAVRELRLRARFEPMDPADMERHIEGAGEAEELEVPALGWITDPDLLLFVERLPLPQQQVLVMHFMLGMTTAEIARVLRVTPNQVAVLQSRALKFLNTRLSAIGRGPRQRERPPSMSRWPKQATVLRKRRFALYR